jgi:2-methylisocitrate lyase-like PEP mutase family enzyme
MSKQSQKEKAEVLLSLHTGGDLLVLPNIWDPIGADSCSERLLGCRDR